MKKKQCIYLVGGYNRDKFLKIKTKEKDWMIVGGDPADLLKLNFVNVGNAFPVFLHPKTKEEYALARKERKINGGYRGFICDNNNEISLKEDLKRRDLTINAIARNSLGKYFDPYNGIKDISKKLLKNISISFIEDPLRVLRTARFLSSLYHLGFKIHEKLFFLMKKIVASGEMKYLPHNRIFKEINKSMSSKNPDIFFKILYHLNSLPIILPILDGMWKSKNGHKKIRIFFFNLYVYHQKTDNISYVHFYFNKFFLCIQKLDLLKKNLKKFLKKFNLFLNLFVTVKKMSEESIFYLLSTFKILYSSRYFILISNFIFYYLHEKHLINRKLENEYIFVFIYLNYRLSLNKSLINIKNSIKRNIRKKNIKIGINNIFYIKLFFYFNYFK